MPSPSRIHHDDGGAAVLFLTVLSAFLRCIAINSPALKFSEPMPSSLGTSFQHGLRSVLAASKSAKAVLQRRPMHEILLTVP